MRDNDDPSRALLRKSILNFRRQFASIQFGRFIVAGSLAALVNFLSRIAFSQVVSYPVAIVLAYCAGIATAYLLTRSFVFGASEKGPVREISWFVLVNVLGVLQTLVVSIGLAWYVFQFVGLNVYREEVAHFIGMCVPAFTSYLGHKYLTFR
jgi:putative flippase GtrA